MGDYKTNPNLIDIINRLTKRVQALEVTQAIPIYTMATRPPSSGLSAGTIIFVSDGGTGNVFQGWNGSAWVSLG